MTSCRSAKEACRLARIDGIETFTTKKSRVTRNAADRTTAKVRQRPGSALSVEAAAALEVANLEIASPITRAKRGAPRRPNPASSFLQMAARECVPLCAEVAAGRQIRIFYTSRPITRPIAEYARSVRI